MKNKKPKYKIKIYDEAHLVDHGEISVSWVKFSIVAVLAVAFFMLIGVGIVWYTPLKKKLPGYMPPEQRAKTEESYLKVDSIAQLYTVHQAYLDNLVKILDTDRNPDLPDTVLRALPLMPDSLLVSSEIEREFMKKMEEAGYIIAVKNDYKEEGDE